MLRSAAKPRVSKHEAQLKPDESVRKNALTNVPTLLFPRRRAHGRSLPPRQLQGGPAGKSRPLQAGCTGHAALPELTAALLRHRRLTRLQIWLLNWPLDWRLSRQLAWQLTWHLTWRRRQSRLRRAGRACRRSSLSGLAGHAGLLRLSRPWRQSRLLLSAPVLQCGQWRLTGLTRQRPRSGLVGLARPLQLSGLLRRTRPRLQTLPVRRARLLLARPQSRLLLQSRPVLSRQAVLAAAGLTGPLPGLADRPVRIHKARIGAAEGALFVEHAAADQLHRMHLPHESRVARDHLRRD
jgi:hypothetical protein